MKGMLAMGACALVVAMAGAAKAQPMPFDMREEGAPVRPSPVPQDAPSAPAPAPARTPADPAPARAEAPPSPTEGERRYLVPMERLMLGGETAARQWGVILTEAEAAGARTIRIGYQNSILVAPEASRLRLLVNGQVVIDTPVQSADAVGTIEVPVPEGLLESGLNTIAFQASLRHRTDCTIESTYDLWTEIEAEETYIAFGPRTGEAFRSLEDLRAVGFDGAGLTRYDIAVPQGRLTQAATAGVRLSQGLSLLGAMPNPSVAFTEGSLPPAAEGALAVVVGLAEEIETLVPALPEQARRAAFAGFVERDGDGPVLVVSGPGWAEVAAAVEEVLAPVDRPFSLTRTALADPGWRNPDAPLLFSATSVPFRDLGVPTQEFSGRLFRTSFAVAVPADFYAEAYGEATILIDAAYSPAVLPGSRIDVYVNGDIATTLPIGSSGGAVLRRYPVPVTMRHFRPGANLITIEAVLDTEADAICLPGTASDTATRFALFDSSTFEMPDFARISRRPNLSALSGVGFPYNRVDGTVPLVLSDPSAETLSAAATLAARVALVAGRPLSYDLVAPALASGRDALFVGPAPRLPAGILPQIGVADTIRTGWSEGGGAGAAAAPATTDASIERWQAEVGGSWRRPFLAIEEWLAQRFDLSMDALRLTRPPDPPYVPPSAVSLVVAQGRDPGDEHTWTVVTARNGAELSQGVAALAREENWTQLAGRLTVYDAAQAAYLQMPANDARFVASMPASFANLRLVAANWLSSNALAYALLLALAAGVLGLTTGVMTGVLGRRK